VTRLKGATIANNIVLVRELLGEEKLRALIEMLPAETQAFFARQVLPVEWIELDHWIPFQVALLERHFGGDEEAFRAYVRETCRRDFSTVYRVVIKLIMSPEKLLDRASSMWSTYVDTGDLKVVSREKQGERTRVVIRLESFPVSHTVYGITLHAFVEQLIAMAGGKDVVVIRPVNHIGEKGLDCELHCSYR